MANVAVARQGLGVVAGVSVGMAVMDAVGVTMRACRVAGRQVRRMVVRVGEGLEARVDVGVGHRRTSAIVSRSLGRQT